MLKNLFKKEKKSSPYNNILIAALLIHAARIDENYTEAEQSEKILNEAEKKEEESNQIVEFTREIKKHSIEFRLKVIEIIWKIVYSDGTSDNYESNLIRRICGLLYISDKDNGIIKTKVINQSK